MKRSAITQTTLKVNVSMEGETIENKVRRIMNNKEPIKDGAPVIHTARKDGIIAELNPRADRFEMAVEMMGKVSEDKIAKRAARLEAIKGNDATPITGAAAAAAGDAK